MTTLHTLGILSTSFTWDVFPTVLKEFPHMLSTCWLLFLHSAVQLIPNQLNGSIGQIAVTQPGGVLGHCPVEKQMIVPLSTFQVTTSWSRLRECQECAKLSSRQRVATLKNLKYKIHFDLFHTFLVTTWFRMYYFIVLMSSLLFYNVENIFFLNKEKPWNE